MITKSFPPVHPAHTCKQCTRACPVCTCNHRAWLQAYHGEYSVIPEIYAACTSARLCTMPTMCACTQCIPVYDVDTCAQCLQVSALRAVRTVRACVQCSLCVQGLPGCCRIWLSPAPASVSAGTGLVCRVIRWSSPLLVFLLGLLLRVGA